MDPLFMGLRHVALNVADVPATVDFYCKVLDMRVEWKPDEENVYLTSGADNIAIHKLPEGQHPGPVQTIHHIGFVVRRPEDVDVWAERIRNYGIPFEQPPKTHRDGARSFYFRDPNGLLIQLIYHPPISGPDKLESG